MPWRGFYKGKKLNADMGRSLFRLSHYEALNHIQRVHTQFSSEMLLRAVS
jgi:hypothetical protein